ncbi:MAG TPA: hypothetical protein VHG28_18665, partial [Longimicrobiaceae bacterium]|nr:hypothetical protein [Longimicrobiaceae bacterium]
MLNVATPLTAATAAVPASVPPEGLFPIVSVTLSVALVTVLPCASWITTWIAGVIAAPAVAFDGCTLKASLAAPAAVVKRDGGCRDHAGDPGGDPGRARQHGDQCHGQRDA